MEQTTREQIARWLRTYKLNEVEGHEPDCIIPWEECSPNTKERWLADVPAILALMPSAPKSLEEILLSYHDYVVHTVLTGEGDTDKARETCIHQLLAYIAAEKEAARKEERVKLAQQIAFEKEDIHIFDTSYGYNQVRIDCVFLNENSELWEALCEEG